MFDELGKHVELGNLEEVRQLVMSWGLCAKVIAPEKLRDWVKKEAGLVARSYSG